MSTTSTTIAGPSPVVVQPEQKMTREERQSWLSTGNLPTRTPKEAPPASAKETEKVSTSATEKVETAPPPEGDKQPKKRATAADRSQELSAEIKELLEKRGVLKADDFWKEFEDFRKTREKKADPPPATETKTEAKAPAAPERPKRPKLADYKDVPEWETAMEAYEDQLLEYPVKKAAFEAAKAQAEKSQKDSEKRMADAIERVNTKYPDAKDVAPKVFKTLLDARASIPEVTWFLNNTTVLPDLLYALGGDFKLDEFVQLGKTDAAKAIRLLAKMEGEIIAEIDGAPKEPAAKTETSEPPKTEKPVTKAAKPPGEVSAQGTTSDDPIKAAVANGDTSTYMKLMNERDIARRQKRGR